MNMVMVLIIVGCINNCILRFCTFLCCGSSCCILVSTINALEGGRGAACASSGESVSNGFQVDCQSQWFHVSQPRSRLHKRQRPPRH